MTVLKNNLPAIIAAVVIAAITAAAVILHNSGAISMNP